MVLPSLEGQGISEFSADLFSRWQIGKTTRGKKGWQVDINAMSRSLIMGGPAWHFLSLAHPYMFAFKNYVIKMNRYYPWEGQKAFLGLSYSLCKKRGRSLDRIVFWLFPAL